VELRFLKFVGPKKEPAEVSFDSGLNLIYGPSNTGKSSILDAIDFMFARERSLKEIPEHEGYDQIFLGIEFSNDEQFTFVRNITGGDYQCFPGLHKEKPEDLKPDILKAKKATKKHPAITEFILQRIGLDNKKLKKNADNKTISLTLRNLLPLTLISETNIQKEGSPFISEQYTEQTEHKSRLKLLLTGVDDSTLLPAEAESRRVSYNARIEFIDELINEHSEKIENDIPEDDSQEELQSQREKLSKTIEREHSLLESTEEQYGLLISERTGFRKELEQNEEREAEISEMLGRFSLLKEQYLSDIKRLENICEAGSIIAVLPSEKCPLCGSKVSESQEHENCDGNLKDIVIAAESEKRKLAKLYEELMDAMNQLKLEKKNIQDKIPKISKNISSVNEKLSELNPELSSKRRNYTDLLDIKLSIDHSLEMFEQLGKLQEKKAALEKSAPEEKASDSSETSLPTKAINDLAQYLKELLENWHFTNSDNVYFDKETGDFVISGKHRISNGKGYRAITHAAATLALMKFCEERDQAHPGFVLLDSPLLAYEEPDNEEDDLTGTDVNKMFFDYVSNWKSRQVIIFENKKSIPSEYASGEQIIHFTKNETGRYGFFPV
jgi:hypothetical protein